jgi:hypothetical protein
LAFLRFSRDKRGYEHFYLVEATTNRRGKTRARVLYWFRTPPGVKVGREPFDAGVRQALESQNPGVAFDWRKIIETPIPSADAEKWRERRRIEKAEKAARRARAADLTDDEAAPADATDTDGIDADESIEEEREGVVETAAPAVDATPAATPAAAPTEGRRRRRRRRRGSQGSRSSESPSSTASPVITERPEAHEPQEE